MKAFKKCLSIILSLVLTVTLVPFTAQAATLNSQPAKGAAQVSTMYGYSAYSGMPSYNGSDLGAVYTAEHTTFKVWSPIAQSAKVNIYLTGSAEEENGSSTPTESVSMTKSSTNGTWSVTLDGDYKNKYYTYSFTFKNGVTTEAVDIYAKAVGVNGNRGMVADLDSTDPEGWDEDTHVYRDKITDARIWEVSINDFSADASSGVSEANRGKYLAFTETGTTVNNEGYYSTLCDYLTEQGINTVQLMPTFDFYSVDETRSDGYNWGYDPKNYNVPEGSFSSNPYDGNVRINEFKQMIMALHSRGISVVMDVVYNHTYATTDSNFELTAPGYYYRMNGMTFRNSSGCGNVTASEHTMYRKFMTDSLMYWAEEYHIDGFRFDLMGCHDVTTMNHIRTKLNALDDGNGSKILMYGEPWTADINDNGITNAAIMDNMGSLSSGIAAFNDKLRNAVKGGNDDAVKGFIQGGGNSESAVAGVVANTSSTWGDNWASSPAQAIQYASAHDNLTLWDKIVKSMGGSNYYDISNSTYNSINKMSASIILTSAGTPFFQAGEEMARTKGGNSNSYNAGTAVNSIKWSQLYAQQDGYDKTRSSLADYYKGLMEIRNAFAPFTESGTKYVGSAKWYFSGQTSTTFAYTVHNDSSTGWKWVAVLHNAGTSAQSVKLGAAETLPTSWTVIADGKKAGVVSLGTKSSTTISVPARTSYILVDSTSFNRAKVKSGKGKVIIQDIDAETNEIITTRERTGTIGSSYTACPNNDSNFVIDYDLASVKGNITGKFTQDDITVSYYYNKYSDSTPTVTIKAVDQNGKTLQTDEYRGRKGETYTVDLPGITNYKLDTASLPANLSGTYGDEDSVITVKYNKIDVKSLLVHFYTEYWTSPVAYLYNDATDKEYFGAWDDCVSNSSAKLTKEATNWYKLTSTNLKDENMRLIIRQATGEYIGQEPYGAGYRVKGEVWIENERVKYNTQLTVSYVDTQGNKLADDSVTDITKACDGDKYYVTAPEISGYTLADGESVKSGNYSIDHPINIVFVYNTEEVTDFIEGDVNADGSVDLLDAYWQCCLSGNEEGITRSMLYAADLTNDDVIDEEDTLKLLEYLAGKITSVTVNCKLTATVKGEGGRVVSGSGTYRKTDVVKVTAAADDGYIFRGWYDGNTKLASGLSYEFTILKDTAITAVFESVPKYNVKISAGENGKLSDSKYENGAAVTEGEEITVTAIPDDTYRFVGWFDENDELVYEDEELTVTVDSDINYTAVFSDKYNMKATAEEGGTASVSASQAKYSEKVTFTAKANRGYKFVGWYNAGGIKVSTSASYTYTVIGDCTLIAKFQSTQPSYTTVYFTNNKNWSNVKIYAFVVGSDPVDQLKTWDASDSMKYVETNDYGQSIYSFYLPIKYDTIIFHDGSSQQTVDIKYSPNDTYNAFYLESKDSSGNWTVGTWKK